MEIFRLTLQQMLMMFSLILVGCLLRKKGVLPDNTHTSLAKLETFVFVPALSLSNQMAKCTVEAFRENYVLILYGFIIALGAILLAHVISRFFVKNHASSPELSYQRSIYRYALSFGNYGFMGNFIVLGVWGSDVFYRYSLLTFGISLLCYGWGLYTLVPKDRNVSLKQNLKKGLLTPPMIALVAGMVLGLLNVKEYVPAFLISALENAGKCQGPVGMLLAGLIIGGYDFKEILLNKKVYAASALRLIVIPAAMILILRALGTSKEIMTLILIAFATPLGFNTIVYPAAYGGDTKTGASMAMISHALSVITIPLMYLIFIVLI